MGSLLIACFCYVFLLYTFHFARCSKAQPEIGFSIVLRDTSAVAVCSSKVELRLCIALISGLAIPTYRLSFIPWDTIAKIVCHAKPELSLYIALIGGFAPPTHCLGFILRNTIAIGIRYAKAVLCLCISGSSLFFEFGNILGRYRDRQEQAQQSDIESLGGMTG